MRTPLIRPCREEYDHSFSTRICHAWIRTKTNSFIHFQVSVSPTNSTDKFKLMMFLTTDDKINEIGTRAWVEEKQILSIGASRMFELYYGTRLQNPLIIQGIFKKGVCINSNDFLNGGIDI